MQRLIWQSRPNLLPIDRATHPLLDATRSGQPHARRSGYLASTACLQVQPYYRNSVECLGISSKPFEQVARFDYLVRLHDAQPHTGWRSLAVAAGYHSCRNHLLLIVFLGIIWATGRLFCERCSAGW